MTTIRWLAENTVRYYVENLRMHIGKPAGYDEAVAFLVLTREKASAKSLADHIAIRKARERVEYAALLEAIANSAKIKSSLQLIDDVMSAAERLTIESRNTFIDVKNASVNKYSAQDVRALGSDLDAFRAAEPYITNEWRITLQNMANEKERNFRETAIDHEIITKTAIKHETSILSARNIVTDCFRVSKPVGNGDHCANFLAEEKYDNQAQRKGCVLHFSWSGQVVTSKDIPTSLDPDTLYEYETWRYALAPGTTKHLVLKKVTFEQNCILEEHGLAMVQILNARGKNISVKVGSTCDFSSWQSLLSSSPSLSQRRSSTGSTLISGLLRRLRPKRGDTT